MHWRHFGLSRLCKKSREQKDFLSKLDVLEESKEINNYYVDSPNLKLLITAWKVLRKLDPMGTAPEI